MQDSVRSERSAQSPVGVEGGWHIPDDTEVSLATEWTEGNLLCKLQHTDEQVELAVSEK